MRWLARVLLSLLLLLTVGVAAFAALAWRAAIDPVSPPARNAFSAPLVERGAKLAAVGNCLECHTTAGGAAYAGGRALATPFGTIYGTNITPDPDTGIGRWSEAAFIRAMREGVDREGRHLYPAFPYHYFVRMQDEDLRALYAFVMTREPVRAEAPENELPAILRFRPLLAGWKLLFHNQRVFEPDPSRSAELNRGAYLVEAVAHCGACHTPMNALGAPERDRYMQGGESEGWHAPALTAAHSTAPEPWTGESIFNYLAHGVDARHDYAAGPMRPVVRNLARAEKDDIRAMAAYVGELLGGQTASSQPAADRGETVGARPPDQVARPGQNASDAGAAIFAGACAICHESAGPVLSGTRVPLAVSSTISYPDPRNLIQVILYGIEAPSPNAPLMPGFADAMSDQQIAALVDYLRTQFSKQPAWGDVREQVRNARQGEASR